MHDALSELLDLLVEKAAHSIQDSTSGGKQCHKQEHMLATQPTAKNQPLSTTKSGAAEKSQNGKSST